MQPSVADGFLLSRKWPTTFDCTQKGEKIVKGTGSYAKSNGVLIPDEQALLRSVGTVLCALAQVSKPRKQPFILELKEEPK